MASEISPRTANDADALDALLTDILNDDALLHLSLSVPWTCATLPDLGPDVDNRSSNALNPVVPSGVYGHVHPQLAPSPATSTGPLSSLGISFDNSALMSLPVTYSDVHFPSQAAMGHDPFFMGSPLSAAHTISSNIAPGSAASSLASLPIISPVTPAEPDPLRASSMLAKGGLVRQESSHVCCPCAMRQGRSTPASFPRTPVSFHSNAPAYPFTASASSLPPHTPSIQLGTSALPHYAPVSFGVTMSTPSLTEKLPDGPAQPKMRVRKTGLRRSHSCDQCDQSYVRAEHLRRHVKSAHMRLKEHACDQCEYRCSRSDNLRQHRRMMHDA